MISTFDLPECETVELKSSLAEDERNTIFEATRSPMKILGKLNLVQDNILTNASILLFGKNPQKHIVQSEIRCARFNGTEPINFTDIHVIRGTIIEQVPAVLNFIRRHINIAVHIDGEPERKEVWEYPKEALREAIVNAICHRNYEDTGNVQVRIFDDRLEVWNPGLLPGNLTIEMLRKDHQSKPRNELIARCFYLIKYIEQWGTGTNRMIKLCLEAGLPGLDFIELCDSFIVIFRRKILKSTRSKPTPKPKPNETQKKIIQYIEEKGEVSTFELMKYLKLTQRSIQRNLKQIEKIIEWTGESPNDPNGKYKLKKNR